MSGALNSIFKGGNIFGALLNIASLAFPPLQILNGLSNLITQGIGQIANQLVDFAVRELGMPKFLGNIAKGVIDNVIGGQQQDVAPGVADAVRSEYGPEANDYFQSVLETSKRLLKEAHESGAGERPTSGSSGAKSWYVRLSMALGQALNAQADKLEALTEKVNKTFSADGKKVENQQKNFDGMQELQAEAQVMSVLSNTISQTVSKIGEALTTASRSR